MGTRQHIHLRRVSSKRNLVLIVPFSKTHLSDTLVGSLHYLALLSIVAYETALCHFHRITDIVTGFKFKQAKKCISQIIHFYVDRGKL